eukprot:scaffold238_cov102-Skeletonema_menzelii.AAC.6
MKLIMPAEQTEAEDCKRAIDQVYHLFTTATLAELIAMTSSSDLKTWFMRQTNPAYRIPPTCHITEWTARRKMFAYDILNKCKLMANEIIRIRSSASRNPSIAIGEFSHQFDLNSLLAGGPSARTLSRLERSMMSSNAAATNTSENVLLSIELDVMFGGISKGASLREELLGLSQLESQFDHENDMIIFYDGRSLAQLQLEHWRVSGSYTYTTRNCMFPFYNEKTITMFLMAREMKRLGLAWHHQVHGEVIRDLLGSGTLHRIGYGTEGTYRVVSTYTSDDIIRECKKKMSIWQWYRNNITIGSVHHWNIDWNIA